MTKQSSALIGTDQIEPIFKLLRRAVRLWWVGLVTFVVVAGAISAAVHLWPRKYRSESSLHYREGVQWTPEEAANTRRAGQRLRELLLSRSNLAMAIQELGLYPELVAAGRMAEAVEEMR